MTLLNSSGADDATHGKIVRMSNTTQESQAFLALMQTYQNKKPKLTLIDGAEGGQDINAINSSTASYLEYRFQPPGNSGINGSTGSSHLV
jgi:hypothetical protein